MIISNVGTLIWSKYNLSLETNVSVFMLDILNDETAHTAHTVQVLTSQAAAVTSDGVSGENAGRRAALTCKPNRSGFEFQSF